MTLLKYGMKNKIPVPIIGVTIVLVILFIFKGFSSERRSSLKVAPTKLSSEGVDEAAHAMDAISDKNVKVARKKKGLQE